MKKKKSILIVVDRPNWAYHNIAKFIIENLEDKYDFYLDFSLNHIPNKHKKYSSSFFKTKFLKIKTKYKYSKLPPENKKIDIVLYLGWYMEENMLNIYNFSYKIKGIYTSGFPPQGFKGDPNITMDIFINKYFSNTNLIVCGSQNVIDLYKDKFKNIYLGVWSLPKPFFKPINKIYSNDSFVIGWTGNPKRSFKGFYNIIIPAINKAQSIEPRIKFKTRFKGPLNTLHKFYDDVDCVIIASVGDAGPSMFLEASLRGVPSISNRSGKPLELINSGENGLFVERKIDEYVEAILKLYKNRKLLEKMSKNINHDSAKYISDLNIIGRWNEIFQKTMSSED